jgi:hypothetical protein
MQFILSHIYISVDLPVDSSLMLPYLINNPYSESVVTSSKKLNLTWRKQLYRRHGKVEKVG